MYIGCGIIFLLSFAPLQREQHYLITLRAYPRGFCIYQGSGGCFFNTYRGNGTDPLLTGDELSVILVKGACPDLSFEHNAGKCRIEGKL